MKTAICKLKSKSPYSQSKKFNSTKGERETHQAFEARVWKERCHVDSGGMLYIPPMAFANSLKEAAKYLSISVPGQGKCTFTKNFEAGVMVVDPAPLPINIGDVTGEWLSVPSDGKRGGSKRVDKCFPVIPEWSAEVTYHILDDLITQDVFKRVLITSGMLIGIGRFRPRNCGYYGRFDVVNINWTEENINV